MVDGETGMEQGTGMEVGIVRNNLHFARNGQKCQLGQCKKYINGVCRKAISE